MAKLSITQLNDIRALSRTLVRELGFMHRSVANTDLSPSAVHAIVEIGLAKSLTANDLCELLILEKSSISRLVKSLLKKELIKEFHSKTDGRVKVLSLTVKGQQQLKAIDAYAQARISTSLQHLGKSDYLSLRNGLTLYTESLTNSRNNKG